MVKSGLTFHSVAKSEYNVFLVIRASCSPFGALCTILFWGAQTEASHFIHLSIHFLQLIRGWASGDSRQSRCSSPHQAGDENNILSP